VEISLVVTWAGHLDELLIVYEVSVKQNLQFLSFAVLGLREKPLRDFSYSSPANFSYLFGPGFCIKIDEH
jgi:hypothetical protein